MQIDDLFYIVGNGPSLKPQVLDKLPKGRWIGMNAAYKYWDKTGNYPHFYSCLDPVVVVQHKVAIERMLSEGKVAEFFLHDEILTVSPQLENDPRVTFLSAFLDSDSLIPVSPMSRYKQTTGVLAARFCIERGFHNLCLLGIDCNYVERIQESVSGSGYELVVKGDVRRNPNYFFDNYQEQNEKYQVPNPEIHSGNLHLQSFIALRDDIKSSGQTVGVFVGSQESLLCKFNIFPSHNVEAELNLRRLEALAVPLMPHELDDFLDRLDLWLNPKLQPSFDSIKGVALHIFMPCDENYKLREKVEAAAHRLPWLSRYFEEIRLTFLDLPKEIDYYIKGTSLNVFCNKSGPNIFWLSMMAACQKYRYTYLMEVDCIPLRAGWLDALERTIATAPTGSWVIGANYAGPTKASAANAYHINGNALYATGESGFQDFIKGEFLKAFKWMVSRISNNVAYDVAFAQGMSRYDAVLDGTGVDLRRYVSRFVHTPTIINFGGTTELEPGTGFDPMAECRRSKDAYLGHGRPFITLVDDRLDELDSFFSNAPGAVTEIRPHSFGAKPKTCDWINKGFGYIEGILDGGASAKQKGDVWVQFRLDVSKQWGKGEIVIALEAGSMLCFKEAVVQARKPKVKVWDLPVRPEISEGRLKLSLPKELAATEDASEIVVKLCLSIVSPAEILKLHKLQVLFYPAAVSSLPFRFDAAGDDAQAVIQDWSKWRAEEQRRVSNKFHFVSSGSEQTILRSLEAKPKAEYAKGNVSMELTRSSHMRLVLNTGNYKAKAIRMTLRADKPCQLRLCAKTQDVMKEQEITLVKNMEFPVSLTLPVEKKQDTQVIIQELHSEGGKVEITKVDFVREYTPEGSMMTFARIISINPDAESFFGHFLNYEVRLGKAVRARGIQHIIAGPVDGEPEVYEANPEMEKVFSVRTNTLYAKTPGEKLAALADFEAELDGFLAGIDSSSPSLLFMYCGSLEIAEVLGRLADRYPNCHFAISLYYLSWLDLESEALQEYWRPKLAELEAHPQMRLIVPSPQLADELKTGFGITPEILPHPTTTFHDDELRMLSAGSQDDKQITVVFPGNQRGGKGYELTRDAILALLAKNPEGLRLRVRIPPDDSLNDTRRAFFESIQDRVDLLDSYLDEKEFRDLLLSADLVVLPYTPDRFSNRTSGLLIDSLLLGIPCVVIRDTWLEWIVQDYGFGLACEESGEGIAAGIAKGMSRVNTLKSAALAARDRYTARNSWDALTAFLATPSQVPTPSVVPTTEGVENRRLLLIGNGPSARLLAEAGFDKIPEDMDTWGTTAAFRYFERIGWWPTWYALADRKVVFHHRESFARLLGDPKVTTKRFFLSWKVADSPKLELISHSSTGSFSLKKAVELGYKEIYLIGMEGAYVEEILESRPLSPEEIAERGFGVLNLSRAESKLRILDQTPTYNPNYFFSGYQQKGDVYSLPQAHTHQANWDGVKAAVKEAGAKVVNLSRISKIEAFERGDIRDVFPYLPENCWEDMNDPFTDKAQHVKSVYEFEAGSAFTQKSEFEWDYRPLEKQNPGALRAQFRHVGVTAGRTLIASATITASRRAKIAIGFGREGKSQYEGTGRFITLEPDAPVVVNLSFCFKNRHQKLKLQISDINLFGAQDVKLRVQNIWISESVDSVIARHNSAELSERRADQAFKEGNDSFALATWLHLRTSPIDSHYDDKISRVAKRIGIHAPGAIEKLKELLRNGSNGVTVEPVNLVSSTVPSQPISNNKRAEAARLLTSYAGKLLIDPTNTYPKLISGGELFQAASDALENLGADDELVNHFIRVKEHVKQQYIEREKGNE